jgi:uroporphyrinogen III methyltransferase/synthase
MSGPLDGLRVLVTRPQGQAGRLSEALRAAGAAAIEVPAIEVVPPASWAEMDGAIERSGYDWVIFTSANGVRFFVERLHAAGRDASWFRDTRVAAIGPETARTLRGAGVEPRLVPDEYVAEALVACVADDGPLTARRVLLPRADIARDVLAVGLTREGAIVDSIVAYRTVPATPPDDLIPALRRGDVDAATFTSSSTVRALLYMLGSHADALQSVTVACIGPVTAATAREAGLTPHVVATTYTIAGLVSALCDYVASTRAPRSVPGATSQGGPA